MSGDKNVSYLDVSDSQALLKLADKIQREHKPCVLMNGDEELALIMPVPDYIREAHKPRRTAADLAAFLESAGGWKDEDTDGLLEKIRESRAIPSRPAPEL